MSSSMGGGPSAGKDSDCASQPPSKKLRTDNDESHTRENGQLVAYTWGKGSSSLDEHTPVLVEPLFGKSILKISMSNDDVYVITNKGELRRWGPKGISWMEVGLKSLTLESSSPADVKFATLSSGPFMHAALCPNGQLFTWGENGERLGHKNGDKKEHPTLVSSLQSIPIHTVSCGHYHTLALAASGALYSWGDNDHTGHGYDGGYQLEPKHIKKLQNVKISNIATYYKHSTAVSENGKLYTWGIHHKQILGHNESGEKPNEVELPSDISSVADIACGSDHSALLTQNGLVYMWGKNRKGQLGLDHAKTVEGLNFVSTLKDPVDRIYCGHECTFALTTEGTVLSWGFGLNGRLGQGSVANVLSPREVTGLESLSVVELSLHGKTVVALANHSTMPRNDTMPLGTACMMMLNDDGFSDVTFAVENKLIHAHRCLLAQRSSVFQAMFLGGMQESTAKTIPIKECQYSVFYKFLLYLYTDSISVEAEEVVGVYRLAEMYDMPLLKDICAKSLEKNLTAENAAVMLCQVSDHDKLKAVCIPFVQKNLAKVTKAEGMKHLYNRGDLLKEVIEGKSLIV